MSDPSAPTSALAAMEESAPYSSDSGGNFAGDFELLRKELTSYRGRWGLFVMVYEHDDDRRRIAADIDHLADAAARVHADEVQHPDWLALENDIAAVASRGAGLVQVFGLEQWLDPLAAIRTEGRLRAWNLQREAFAAAIAAPVLCWLRPAQSQMLSRVAPDLWSWRAGVHRFLRPLATPAPATQVEVQRRQGIDNRSFDERLSRIAELKTGLADRDAHRPDTLLATMFDELASLHASIGEVDEALRIRKHEELPVYDRLGNVRARAITMGKIANILEARGKFDEALRIRKDEMLPAYERLGEVRSRAITLGDIADVLQTRGQLDEALRIRREEELPVYECLNDVRSRAVTMGRIADILQARGQLDEALRICRDEVLPVFDTLGDVRSRAVTMGQIADILQARGQLDEALRIRKDEELPVYDRLGDVHARAITMGCIADILQARGQLDEALRIHREDELPIYERLGDVRAQAVTMGRIADILQARGQLDDALRIRREDELPVYVRLGEVRELLVARAKLAQILHVRGRTEDEAEITTLLTQALAEARRLDLPEAAKIEAFLRRLGANDVAT